MTIPQISIFLENRVGQLAAITKILADNNIDMRAISIAENADYGIVRLITDQPERTASILVENGIVLSLTPVLAVAVPDRVGGLANLLGLLSDNAVSVEYMYSLFTHANGCAYMVFRVADEEKFVALLEANGMQTATKEEIGIK